MEKQKSYEELTIRDHFMFGKICSKPENRKLILDSLLQIDFKEKPVTSKNIFKNLRTLNMQSSIYLLKMMMEPFMMPKCKINHLINQGRKSFQKEADIIFEYLDNTY